jgi:hypothetical protein
MVTVTMISIGILVLGGGMLLRSDRSAEAAAAPS